MASLQGLGVCLIHDATGDICGQQIQQGEPIGTVIIAGAPQVGHRRCADAHHCRIAEANRALRTAMVKRIDQGGPGGAVNHTTEREGIQGSIPLEPPDPTPTPESNGQGALGAKVAVVEPSPGIISFQPPTGSPLPTVDATDGWVRLSGIEADAAGFVNLDPADAEDLRALLTVTITRAWRQRQ